MKSALLYLSVFLIALLLGSCKAGTKQQPLPVKTDITEFLGQWTIDIEGGGVGWLEVRQEDNYLDADVLWGGGSV